MLFVYALSSHNLVTNIFSTLQLNPICILAVPNIRTLPGIWTIHNSRMFLHFQNISNVFDMRAVMLVDPAQRAKHGVVTDNKPGFVSLSSQVTFSLLTLCK